MFFVGFYWIVFATTFAAVTRVHSSTVRSRHISLTPSSDYSALLYDKSSKAISPLLHNVRSTSESRNVGSD